MSGTRRYLMEVNGDSGAIEEIHLLQGETIPPIQPRSFGVDLEGAMFL